MVIATKVIKEMIFWMAWIIIPLFWEIMPAIVGVYTLIRKRIKKSDYEKPIIFPDITIIVPVYNSSSTLKQCLDSICSGTYPVDRMEIYVVDNGSKDNSYQLFLNYQKEHPEVSIWWLVSKQGKSKALNMALFNSKGKYIIHVDSDGIIEASALERMVKKFEANSDVHCMTGSILIEPRLIEDTKDYFLKLTRRCEIFEYCNAFLAGRNYESEFSSLYTLSGAFSAFRKSAILKTFLYNSITVCEDTHVTFQIRVTLGLNIDICEDALFFVDPIDDWNKLYTQRQRWQRGEIEVSHMFLADKMKARSFFTNFMVRVLMYDHTFAFPRLIWYFAIIYLFFLNYPLYLIIGSVFILYLLYALAAFLFYICVRLNLYEFKDIQKYYSKLWYIAFIYPAFNLAVFFIRMAGIINSIKTGMTWKTKNITEEWNEFIDVIKRDLNKIKISINKLKRMVNNE